jgi:UDP-N-acetylmuramoyl-L-alanyl-D-glutamate--2,6-diaminopimelate ligase
LSAIGYGISFFVDLDERLQEISLPLLGKFNASNALAVLAVARECFKLPVAQLASAFANAHVCGRTETVRLANGACAVVDYAHNGESLAKLLTALHEYKPTRLICLFGSVGERSHLRRREMGDAAARLCDLAILTSDNPGREPPELIIDEIAAAFAASPTPYRKIPDRKEAILTALDELEDGDVLLLAGKGHETYQLIGTEKQYFCEREIVASYVEQTKNNQPV